MIKDSKKLEEAINAFATIYAETLSYEKSRDAILDLDIEKYVNMCNKNDSIDYRMVISKMMHDVDYEKILEESQKETMRFVHVIIEQCKKEEFRYNHLKSRKKKYSKNIEYENTKEFTQALQAALVDPYEYIEKDY